MFSNIEVKGWTKYMDKDHSNRVNWHEFYGACKRLGMTGDVEGASPPPLPQPTSNLGTITVVFQWHRIFHACFRNAGEMLSRFSDIRKSRQTNLRTYFR